VIINAEMGGISPSLP